MIKMPWNNITAPNVMLEITDACNINCRVCYKQKGNSYKSPSQIEDELAVAVQSRKLHTITISGGEPTLHPDLELIIRKCKKHNLHVFLLTNGVLINSDYIIKLRDSGLDSIMFHVDEGQVRPDLPNPPAFNDLHKRLTELISIAAPLGIDVSMSMTMYDDNWDRKETRQMVEFFMSCPDLTFLFISKAIDLQTGYSTISQNSDKSHDLFAYKGTSFPNSIGNLCRYFSKEYDIEPFAFIPSSDDKYSCWISFFIPVIYAKESKLSFKIRSNLLDSMLMEIPKIISGRYIHKTRQNSYVTLLRVFINAISTWRFLRFLKFFGKLICRSSMIRHKMIGYDNGPFFNQDNELLYCEYCPTAIVRAKKVAPCCSSNFKISKGQINEHTCNHSMV